MSLAVCAACWSAVSHTARFCSRCGAATGLAPPSAVEQQPLEPQAFRRHQQSQFYQQSFYQSPSYQHPPLVQQIPIHQQSYGYGVAPAVYPVEPKDKTVAALLAVFIGMWTWIYTYKKDAWKFWLSFALHLTLFNPLWTWVVVFLPNIALHVWAVIDVAMKPQEFYEYYPNR